MKLCQPVYYDKVKLDYYDKMKNPLVGLCQLFNSQMQDINWTKRQRRKQRDKNHFFLSAQIFGDHTDGVCIWFKSQMQNIDWTKRKEKSNVLLSVHKSLGITQMPLQSWIQVISDIESHWITFQKLCIKVLGQNFCEIFVKN